MMMLSSHQPPKPGRDGGDVNRAEESGGETPALHSESSPHSRGGHNCRLQQQCKKPTPRKCCPLCRP